MVEGLAPPTRAVCTFTGDDLQEATDPICLSTHVWCKPVLNYVFFTAVNQQNNSLFCIELIQRSESSLRRHKLGLTDQSILSNDDKPGLHVSIDWWRQDIPKTYAEKCLMM